MSRTTQETVYLKQFSIGLTPQPVVVHLLLVRQRDSLIYGGMQQANSSGLIPCRLSRNNLVFVCDFRARLF